MGEYVDSFPEPLKSRLLGYAQMYGDADSGIASIDDLNSYTLPLKGKYWNSVMNLIGYAEVESLTENNESTSKTREVEEVESHFQKISPTPERLIDAFPEPLKSRLLGYANKYNARKDYKVNKNGTYSPIERNFDIESYSLPLDDNEWREIRKVIGLAEVDSLIVEPDWESTPETIEVEEVTKFFLGISPTP